MRPLRFAMDHCFPPALVEQLSFYLKPVMVSSYVDIDERLPELDDWEAMVAIFQHSDRYQGIITTDSALLAQEREMAVLHQTKLSLLVARGAGDDSILASGIVLTHLPRVAKQSTRSKPQVWSLGAGSKPPKPAWHYLERKAEKIGMKPKVLYRESRAEARVLRDPMLP